MVAKSNRFQMGVPARGKSPRMSARGRVCQMVGCTTVLSIYNATGGCSVHELQMPKNSRLNLSR